MTGPLTQLLDHAARIEYLEALPVRYLDGVHNAKYVTLLDNAAINAAATVTTGDVRGDYGVPAFAAGILLMLRGTADGAGYLCADSADDTPDVYSPRVDTPTAALYSGLLFVRLGVTQAGKIKVLAVTANYTGIYASVVGYWT